MTEIVAQKLEKIYEIIQVSKSEVSCLNGELLLCYVVIGEEVCGQGLEQGQKGLLEEDYVGFVC